MKAQRVKAPYPTPLRGIAQIAAMLAILYLSVLLGRALEAFVDPSITMVATLAIAATLIWFLLKEQIAEYQYTLDQGRLYVERIYGMRGKLLLNVRAEQIAGFDSEAALRRKYPSIGRAQNATLRRCPLATMGIAYHSHGVLRLVLVQPDEQIQQAILDAMAQGQPSADPRMPS